MVSLEFYKMKLTWLESTQAIIDGGPVFGPVWKAVWAKKYPTNEQYEIQAQYDPILIQYDGKNYLIDAGFDTSKFNAKTFRNTGVQEESKLMESLKAVGLQAEDIDVILMTHMHNDHASGLTRLVDGEYISVFPNATIYVSETEWQEINNVNNRTKGTYLEENWKPIEEQFIRFQESIEIIPGIEMFLAGGHSKGLSVIKLSQEEDALVHISDLYHTTASNNPLWVTAFDDYPMDSVAAKEYWLPLIFENNWGMIFYHDTYYAMLKFDKTGEKVIDYLARDTKKLIPWPATLPKLHEK